MASNTTQSCYRCQDDTIGLSKARKPRAAASDGFTIIEMSVVLLIAMIIAGMAVPLVKSSINSYQLRSAVNSATWAIQSTRFQSLMGSYPFQLTIQGDASGNNPTCQISSEPPGTTTFTNIGTAVPLSGSPVNLTAATVIQFKPNGAVTVTQSGSTASSFQISYAGKSNTVTVSNYGTLSVTSP